MQIMQLERRALLVYILRLENAPKLKNKMLNYRRETALQDGLVIAQNGKLELGDNTLRTLKHCDVIGRQSNRNQ